MTTVTIPLFSLRNTLGRGNLAGMIPGLGAHFGKAAMPLVDGS
jgi:hypothetical protein